jgi:1,4-dihydroxy-2-naphthoate octaprenyltransferase
MIVSPLKWTNHVLGLWKLIRIFPVLCWGGGAVLLGASTSFAYFGLLFPWQTSIFALLAVLLLQGIAAHALNDYEDWKSGTDKSSPGILSGGSGVLRLNLLTQGHLLYLHRLSLGLSIALTSYLCYRYTNMHLFAFLLVGLWAAVAYTCSPFRLSYRPLLGEWLAAWPAMVACTTGTTFLVMGTIPAISWWAGVVHATISIAWLMQHHLPDIPADLTAKPPKNTTVAYLCARWGWRYVTMPGAIYFFFVVVLGFMALPLHNGFAFSILAGLLGMILSLTTDPGNLSDVTRKQLGMMTISCLHFCLLSLWFVYY